jgi:uncharacterized protein (DUF305 family)
VVASVVVCGLLLAGCTSDPGAESEPEPDAPVVQLGAPGEDNRTLSPDEQESLGEAPGHTPEDVAFVQGMIPHHRQALEMTAMVERRADDPRLALLAERIEVSQVDEIRQMRDWLVQRGEDVDGAHGHHDHHGGLMPGMLTRAELAQLAHARDERFDRLFLLYMIRHHEGAIAMVNELLGGGAGGQEPAVFQIAQHVDADQRVEIARMKKLLRG